MTDSAAHAIAHAHGTLTPAQRRRSLIAIITSAGVVGLSLGLAFPMLALMLERDGIDPTWIGVNAAATSVAILLTGPFVPRILNILGPLRAMYLSVAAHVVLILLLPVFDGWWPWLFMRFVLGIFDGIHWIVGETWLIALSSKANRGRVIALYMMALVAGFAGGPLLINLVGIAGWAPFLACAGLIALSGIPLLLAIGLSPRFPPHPPAAFSDTFRKAPLLLAAAGLAGLTGTALFSLLAVYGIKIGMPQDHAVIMLTAMMLGNLALQLPIGWLADRVDRRGFMVFCGVIFLVCPLALPAVVDGGLLLWPVLVIWGGASIGIYTLALTILGDRFPPAALAGANAAVVAVYETGSVAGPIIGGAGMDAAGPQGLMWVLAGAAGLFLLFALYREIRRRSPADVSVE